MVRVGLLSQQQVIDALNEHFVSVEIDATLDNGVPDDVPALAPLQKFWDTNPWTRASFGTEWVIDPTGRQALSMPPHKHLTIGIPMTKADRQFIRHHMGKDVSQIGSDRLNAVLFQILLESGLKRHYRLARHEAGSEEYRQEMAKVAAEVNRELKECRPCMFDVDLSTNHTLVALFQGDPQRFLTKLVGVLQYKQEAEVRRKAAASLGRWVATLSEERRGHESVVFLGDQVALLLDDEDEGVRVAAAVALHRFTGQPDPDVSDPAALANRARTLWQEAANSEGE